MNFKKYILTAVFLLLFIGGVFSSVINPEVINKDDSEEILGCSTITYLSSISDTDYLYNNNSGCYTVKLPEESVDKIWKNLLINNFKIDEVGSDLDPNPARETLENPELLLTSSDEEAGNVVKKIEVPNKAMKPEDLPSLINQSCSGPFSMASALDKTFRVGRCTDLTYDCYLEGFGLFRNNGIKGFTENISFITDDFLDWIGTNKLREAVGEVALDGNYDTGTTDLGLFTDLSYEEISDYKKYLQENDTQSLELKTTKFVLDKAIKNSTLTQNFSASMETTCSGSGCYINMYSMFDKLYNMYFSADMVLSSFGPIMLNSAATLASKATRTAGLADYIKHPLTTTAKKIKDKINVSRYTRNKDAFINRLNKFNNINKARNLTLLQKNGITENLDDFWKIANDTESVEKYISENIIKSKLNATQKRVLANTLRENAEIVSLSHKIIEKSKANKDVMEGLNIIQGLRANNQTIGTALPTGITLTKKQYDSVFNLAENTNKMNEVLKKISGDKYKYDLGIDDVFKNRTISNGTDIVNGNFIKPTGYSHAVNPASLSKNPKMNPLSFTSDGSTYSSAKALGGTPTTVTLADGTINVKKITAYGLGKGSEITPATTFSTTNDLLDFLNKNNSGYIEFFDGTTRRTIPISNFDTSLASGNLATLDPKIFQSAEIPLPDSAAYDPLELASYSLTNKKVGADSIKKISENYDKLTTSMKNTGWWDEKGLSYISEKMRATNNHIGSFLAHPIQNAAQNLLFWKAYSGFEGVPFLESALSKYSLYQIPEDYTAIKIKHGDNPIYNDAYIDFFANDGSDEGDLFKEYLNSALFWGMYFPKVLLEETLSEYSIGNSINKFMKNITEGKIKRNETDDIVLFTDNINSGCGDSCRVSFITNDAGNVNYDNYMKMKAKEETKEQQETKTENDDLLLSENETEVTQEQTKEEIPQAPLVPKIGSNNKLQINFNTTANVKTQNYVLEKTSKENLDKKGQVLISFSHHTDYDMVNKEASSEDAMNLAQSINNEETCADKIRQLQLFGMPIGGVVSKLTGDSSHRLGLYIQFQQHLGYFLTSATGVGALGAIPLNFVLSTLPNALLIMPQIKDCSDVEEGYYSHIFVSKDVAKELDDNSKEKVIEVVEEGVDKIEETLTKVTEGTVLDETVKTGTDKTKEFLGNLKEYPIVQSTFLTYGNTTHSSTGQLFYVELGPGSSCRAGSYTDEGTTVLKNNDTNESLIIDKKEGTMSFIDKDNNVIDIIGAENSDFVRLVAQNFKLPAYSIPNKLSYIPVPNDENPLFEVDAYGNFYVKNNEFFNCLKIGYKLQTGNEIPTNTNSLVEYFGKVTSVATISPMTVYNITPSDSQIVAEGVPRKIARGNDSKITVLGNRKTYLEPLENNKKEYVGDNIAIQFERGQIIYNPEKDNYVMWVQHTSVTSGKDIDELNATLNEEIDGFGECSHVKEIAFDFKATAVKDNPNAEYNVGKLNSALDNVGPFQMFDTPTKTFIFYIGDPPECERRMKIIDKETGEVYDQKITDIMETPEGFIIKTEDGAQHKLDFSVDNGVPKVSYNDDVETLLSAQGKNGSFWFDPSTGNWYTENGQLIPYNNQYKDGISFSVNKDGSVTGTPAQNILNIGTGTSGDKGGSFNLPLLPENNLLKALYILIILTGALFIFNKNTTRRKKYGKNR